MARLADDWEAWAREHVATCRADQPDESRWLGTLRALSYALNEIDRLRERSDG